MLKSNTVGAAERFGAQRPRAAGEFARSINRDGAATPQTTDARGPPAAPGWAARTERGTPAAAPDLSRPAHDWRTAPPSTTASGTSADACASRVPAGPDAPPNEWAISGRRPLQGGQSINVDGAAAAQNATAAGPPAAPGWAARTERDAASSHRSAEPLPDWRCPPPARNEPAETETSDAAGASRGLTGRTRRPTIGRSAAGGRWRRPEV